MAECTVDQLVIAIVAGSQAGALIRTLTRDGFYVTQIASSGGVVREATVSLLVGLDQVRLPQLLDHIRIHCRTHIQYVPVHLEATLAEIQPLVLEAQAGGATVYVLDVERFEQV